MTYTKLEFIRGFVPDIANYFDPAQIAAGGTTGYFSGGNPPNFLSSTEGLDFSSDTTTMVTKGSLTSVRDGSGSAASGTVGYCAGGRTNTTTGAPTSETNGLTFSTDTSTMVTKGALTGIRTDMQGAESSTLAYFAGGGSGNSELAVDITDGLTFATDTTAMVTKGALTTVRISGGGAESSTVGYYAGGTTTHNQAAGVATNNGLTFSTDTTAQVTKGALTAGRNRIRATSSSTLGYWAGGSTGSDNTHVTTCDGLDYSTDTTAMVTKGALTVAKFEHSGAQSSTIGYYAGGGTNTTGGGETTGNNGLTFSTDTTAMVTKGVLVTARMKLAGYEN